MSECERVYSSLSTHLYRAASDRRAPPARIIESAPPPVFDARVSTAVPKPKFSSSRARQLHEMRSLRAQAAELETLLARLRSIALPPSAALAALVGDGNDGVRAVLAMKRVAERQRSQLTLSKKTNEQLRESIKDHKLLALSLHRMLRIRAVKCAVLSEHMLSPFGCLDLSGADYASIATLIDDISGMRARADATFRDLERRTPSCGSFCDWHVRSDSTGSLSLVMTMCEEMPFQEAQVITALHSLRRGPSPRKRCHDISHLDPPPETEVTCEMVPASGGSSSKFARHLDVRRTFSGADGSRWMNLAVMLMEPVDEDGRPAPGYLLKVQAFATQSQRTHEDEATGVKQYSTVARMQTVVTLVAVRGGSAEGWNAATIHGKVIPVWNREVATKRQQIENMLLKLRPAV